MITIKSVSVLLNPALPVPRVDFFRFYFGIDSITGTQGLFVEGFDSSKPAKTFSNFCHGCMEWFAVELTAEIIGHEVIVKPKNT